jgi:hypothetical protein
MVMTMALKQPANTDSAETVGLKALAFLAADEDELSRFLALSGLDIADIRERAGDAGFLAAVIDHVLSSDALLTAFCEGEGLIPKDVHLASHKLGGA